MGEAYSREALINAVQPDLKVISYLPLFNVKRAWKRYLEGRPNLRWDIDVANIQNSFSIKSYQAKRVFNAFDIRKKGKIASFDLFCGVIFVSDCSPEEKIRFIYKIFNCTPNYEITSDGLRIILASAVRGYSIMKNIECPSFEEILDIYHEALTFFDHPQLIPLIDCIDWCLSNRLRYSLLERQGDDLSALRDVPSLVKAEGEILSTLETIDCEMRIENDFKENYEFINKTVMKEVKYDETGINETKASEYSVLPFWHKLREYIKCGINKMKSFKKNVIKRAGHNVIEIQPNPKIHSFKGNISFGRVSVPKIKFHFQSCKNTPDPEAMDIQERPESAYNIGPKSALFHTSIELILKHTISSIIYIDILYIIDETITQMIEDLEYILTDQYIQYITHNVYHHIKISLIVLNSDRVLRISLYSDHDIIDGYTKSFGCSLNHLLCDVNIDCGITQSFSDIIEQSQLYLNINQCSDEEKEMLITNIFNTFSSNHQTLSYLDMNKIQSSLHTPMSLRFENEEQFASFLQSERLNNIRNELTLKGFLDCYKAKPQLIYDLNSFGIGGLIGLCSLSVNYKVSLYHTIVEALENNILKKGVIKDRYKKMLSFLLSMTTGSSVDFKFPSLLTLIEKYTCIPTFLKQPAWYPLYTQGCEQLLHNIFQTILKYAMVESEIEILSEIVEEENLLLESDQDYQNTILVHTTDYNNRLNYDKQILSKAYENCGDKWMEAYCSLNPDVLSNPPFYTKVSDKVKGIFFDSPKYVLPPLPPQLKSLFKPILLRFIQNSINTIEKIRAVEGGDQSTNYRCDIFGINIDDLFPIDHDIILLDTMKVKCCLNHSILRRSPII